MKDTSKNQDIHISSVYSDNENLVNLLENQHGLILLETDINDILHAVKQDRNKTETMKDLTKYFIDLSKCTEEQRKHIFSLLPEPINRDDYDITPNHFYLIFDDQDYMWWVAMKHFLKHKQELTYPEFIQLFEGSTKLPSELLKEYFKNTPREQVLKDWESTSDYDNVNSPKVLELFEGGEGEIDIEKLAKEALKFQHKNIQHRMIDFVLGFEEGFKKAMELNSNQ